MRKLTSWIPTALVMAVLVLVVWATNAGEVIAQDTVAKPVAEKNTDSAALKDFKSRLGNDGLVVGPFNIVVSPTDKGANGIKYTNVPYIQFLYDSMMTFPVGKRDRWGNQEYLYVTNYTVTALIRVNPAERSR